MRKKKLTLSMSAIMLLALLVIVSVLTYHTEFPAFAAETERIPPTPTPAPNHVSAPVEQGYIDEIQEYEPPPLLIHQILDETIPTPRYLVPLTDNPMVNVLLYSFTPAVEAIRENMEMFLTPELKPNQEWIDYAEALFDAVPPLGENVMVTFGEDGEPIFMDMLTGEIVKHTPVDFLTQGIYHTLVNTDSAFFPSARNFVEVYGFSEIPHFITSNKLENEIMNMVFDTETAFPDMKDIIIDTTNMPTVDILHRLFEYDIVEALMTYKELSEAHGFSADGSSFSDTSFILEIERYLNPSAWNRWRVTNTRIDPYYAVAYLEIVFPRGNGTVTADGSGFLISQNKVVTAGHNIFFPGFGLAQRITVVPGRNAASMPYGLFGLLVRQNDNVFIPPEMLGGNYLNHD